MICKATKVSSIKHAGALATHLQRTDENDWATVISIDGTARPDDLAASLKSMQRATELTRGKTGLFHLAISPRDEEGHRMKVEDWETCVRAAEQEFGLAGQPRAVVMHQKEGGIHIHAVWQLTDTEKQKLIDIRHEYHRCKKLGREMEKQLGHEPVKPKNERNHTFSRDQQQQAKRTKDDIARRRAWLTSQWTQSTSADDFRKRLQDKGYLLTKGDRAGFVVVDRKGEVMNLAREIEGVKTAAIRERMEQSCQPFKQTAAVQERIRQNYKARAEDDSFDENIVDFTTAANDNTQRFKESTTDVTQTENIPDHEQEPDQDEEDSTLTERERQWQAYQAEMQAIERQREQMRSRDRGPEI